MKHPLPNTFNRSCQRMAGIALLLLLGLAQPAGAALVVNAGNGTVTDSTTSLVWDKCPYGLSGATCTTGTALLGTWPHALDAAVAANTANYKGFSDWRVPNVKELQSITKIDTYTAGQPAIDTTAFPGTPLERFWTSTAYAYDPDEVWFVYFSGGEIASGFKTSNFYVRLVRSGQSLAAFDVLASADLSITKTDGVTTAVPGASVSYTITASNAGPSAVAGAIVSDTFSANLTPTWTCVGAGGGTCAASGSGNLNDSTVNLPVGASVTYTVSAAISAAATGTLSNTATVSSATTDPNPANNSATDTDTLTPRADLAITKTDGVTSVVAGGSVTYTITASNAGPSNAPGTVVADALPAALTGATWTCAGAGGGICTASGSGSINDTVNLPAGGAVTYTVSATVNPAASGTLSNTATVTAAAGITDPTPGNNSATDSDTVTAQADLAITVTGAPNPVTAGTNLTYTVTVGNSGPSAAATAAWSDTLPTGTAFVSLNTVAGWSCTTPAVGAGGTVACNKASLAAASSAGFTLVVAVASATPAATVLTNTVTVSSATTDATPGNNSATAAATVTTAPIDPPPPPPQPEVTIPLLSIPSACGPVVRPSIVNLGAGEGPVFMAHMVSLLSNALGMPLAFVQQTACGSVVLSGYNGGNLAFIAYGFQTGDGRANGIYPVGNGQYTVVANGQSLVIAPTLVQLDQLIALLPGLSASQGDNGVITATFNGVTYVVQAGAGVQLDPASGSARLLMGSDGYFHFIDALGNNQILYPAFAEAGTLRNILLGLDSHATLSVQLDGTASVVFNGLHYTLVPDLSLGSIPTERVGQNQWQEGAVRYRIVNVLGPLGTQSSQGFTVKP